MLILMELGTTEGHHPMRYVLAAIFVCSIGMPAVSALPTASSHPVSMSKADPQVQAARRNRPSQQHSRSGGAARHHRSRSGDGGIHPLVGSGDY